MRKFNKLLSALALVLLLCSAFSTLAFADSFSLQLPATVKLQGNPDTPADFVLELRAITPGAPMPEGSVDGVCTLNFKGPGTENFPAIELTYPRRLLYSIRQVQGNEKYYSYDNTVYTLEIVTQNTGSSLGGTVVLSKDNSDAKANELLFVNKYEPPKPFPQTGDESNFALYGGLCSAALLGLAFILYFKKKHEN